MSSGGSSLADPSLSVVIPMFRTAAHLPELLQRLDRSVPHAEVVLVDDHCPERSGQRALSLYPGSLRVVVRHLSVNVGQHAAVHYGLAAATGPVVAVMDADLQDRPEALAELLAALAAHPEADVVCAARTGHHSSLGRERTARAYRATARVLSRGRIPPGAAMFLVAHRHAVDAVRTLDDPMAPLVPAFAAAGQHLVAVPLHRDPRREGRSGHRGSDRLRIAARGLATLTPARRLVAARHRRSMAASAVEITDCPLPHAQEPLR